jgi:hypothetical protein
MVAFYANLYKRSLRVFYLLTQDALLRNHRMHITVHFRGLGQEQLKLIQIAFHSPSLRPIGQETMLLTRELNNASMHLIPGVRGVGQRS